MEEVKCTNCKCWRCPDDFIGKKGGIVKRCIRCREKDDKQKQKESVRKRRNELQREKQYYKEYREKKRNKDEKAFLAHNAEIAKKWRNNNKEYVSLWQKHNYNNRISSIKQQSKVKGIPWSADMTDEYCKMLISRACFYCNNIDDERVHGIDRMDNNQGYNLDNCVSCCKKCNFITPRKISNADFIIFGRA